jgi:hypothetical protein
MDAKRLIELYPRLYHMAELGTWRSIREIGLMSASAVLDHVGMEGPARLPFESAYRHNKMTVARDDIGPIVLRDQKPMPRERLLKALPEGVTPEDWYRTINSKVFFWATKERLVGLLNAREYRDLTHDVLTVDTERLVSSYADKIWLCHINSGSTWRFPTKRDLQTFKRIEDYPARANGNPLKAVVELVVDNRVPDIADYVMEVHQMRGAEVLAKTF